MKSLIEKLGGSATVAPSMQEVPLSDNKLVFDFADQVRSGSIDLVIYFTGVGTRTLIHVLQTEMNAQQVRELLNRCTNFVRGPKPTAVLKEWNIKIDYRAPEPNTWQEILQILDDQLEIKGKTVAVQEYGKPDPHFYRELVNRGANVVSVPVYQWALPDDTAPLEAAIKQTIENQFDGLLFTSAQQVHNVLTVAEMMNCKAHWLQAARDAQVCSIGPTCSAAIRSVKLPVHCEASPPKMAHLVRIALETIRQTTA